MPSGGSDDAAQAVPAHRPRPRSSRPASPGSRLLLGHGVDDSAAPVDLGLPAWLLVPAFFAAEVWAVHLHVRGRQAQSFTLSEVPLVVGLFACAPLPLLAARLIGGGAALAQGGRQSPVKLVYNLACFAFETMLAHLPVRPAPDRREPAAARRAGWPRPVSVAVGRRGQRAAGRARGDAHRRATRLRRPSGKHLLAGLVVGATNSSLALLAVLAARANRIGVVLVVVPALVLFVAYRAHHANRGAPAASGSCTRPTGCCRRPRTARTALEASAAPAGGRVRRRARRAAAARTVRGEPAGSLLRYRAGASRVRSRCAGPATSAAGGGRCSHVGGSVLLPAPPPGALRRGGGAARGDQGGAARPADGGERADRWAAARRPRAGRGDLRERGPLPARVARRRRRGLLRERPAGTDAAARARPLRRARVPGEPRPADRARQPGAVPAEAGRRRSAARTGAGASCCSTSTTSRTSTTRSATTPATSC